MQIDGLTLSKVIPELRGYLINQRVNKVFMPSESRFYFSFFKDTLLVSLLNDASYLQIVPSKEDSPFFPPAFVMLLRKYLKGAVCTDISQIRYDRIVRFDFLNHFEENRPKAFTVFIELMGRSSNLIFCDSDRNIIDVYRRKAASERSLFPQNQYVPFLKSPAALTLADWDILKGKESLEGEMRLFPAETSLLAFLEKGFEGFGHLAATEICYRAGLRSERTLSSLCPTDIEDLNLVLASLREELTQDDGVFLWETEEALSLVSATFMHTLDQKGFRYTIQKPSDALQEVFFTSRKKRDLQVSKLRYQKLIDKEIKKVESNLFSMQSDLSETVNHSSFQQYGKLILANLFCFEGEKKYDSIEVEDWETGGRILIPLDSKLSLSANAQIYFKKSTRLKRRNDILGDRLRKYQALLYYLQQIQQSLYDAEDQEALNDIVIEIDRENRFVGEDAQKELTKKSHGLAKSQRKKKTAMATRHTGPSEYRVFEKSGFRCLVGKNNYQNDRLIKDAKDGDLWFHVQGIPGAHVILKNKNQPVPEEVFLFAAQLAARYSKAYQSARVPVDYTDVKDVKKPKGFRPGMVTYRNHKTVFVDPYDENEKAPL